MTDLSKWKVLPIVVGSVVLFSTGVNLIGYIAEGKFQAPVWLRELLENSLSSDVRSVMGQTEYLAFSLLNHDLSKESNQHARRQRDKIRRFIESKKLSELNDLKKDENEYYNNVKNYYFIIGEAAKTVNAMEPKSRHGRELKQSLMSAVATQKEIAEILFEIDNPDKKLEDRVSFLKKNIRVMAELEAKHYIALKDHIICRLKSWKLARLQFPYESKSIEFALKNPSLLSGDKGK